MRPPRRPQHGQDVQRRLTPEERALWTAAVHAASPLVGKKAKARNQIEAQAPRRVTGAAATPAESRPRSYDVRSYSPPSRQEKHAPIPERLERPLHDKVSRGRIAIDRRLDLHGLRQSEAHVRLKHFVTDAYFNGDRTVIVITGKGGVGDAADITHSASSRGVLRRLTPQWLASADLRAMIVGFDEASAAHGGSGALYVRIRRRRDV